MVSTNETSRDFQITESSRKTSLHCDMGAVSARLYFKLDALKRAKCGPRAW